MLLHTLEPYPQIDPRFFKYLREKWYKIFLHRHDVIKEKISWIIIKDTTLINIDTLLWYTNLKYICIVWNNKIKDDMVLEYINKNNIQILHHLKIDWISNEETEYRFDL